MDGQEREQRAHNEPTVVSPNIWARPLQGVAELPDTHRDPDNTVRLKNVLLNVESAGEVELSLHSLSYENKPSVRVVQMLDDKDIAGSEMEEWQRRFETHFMSIGMAALGKSSPEKFPYPVFLKTPSGGVYRNEFISMEVGEAPIVNPELWEDENGERVILLIPDADQIYAGIEIRFGDDFENQP